MNREMGLANFWAQGDAITHTVAIVLLLLSVASWYVMVSKAYSLWLSRRCHARALASFWGAPSLPAAIEAIRNEDKTGIFASLAIAGANSAELYRQHSDRGIGAGVSASLFISLLRRLSGSRRRIRRHAGSRPAGAQAENRPLRGLRLSTATRRNLPFFSLPRAIPRLLLGACDGGSEGDGQVRA